MKEEKKKKEVKVDPEVAFSKAYEELCAKHGLEMVAVPLWRPRDDGTFSMVLQYKVFPSVPTQGSIVPPMGAA